MKKLVFVFCLFSCIELFAFDISTKGFLTFAYRKSDSPILYNNAVSEEGEYSEGTQAGLQFHSNLSNKLDGFLQILADGGNGREFSFNLDIAHINYSYSSKHQILAGKIRLPVWMISDYLKVGSLYPWINAPEEVYEIVPLDTIGANHTFFGVSFEGLLYQKGLQSLNYRFYHGGNENNRNNIRSRVKNLHGLVLEYKFDDYYLKSSYLNSVSSAEREVSVGTFTDASFGRGEFFSLGGKYDGEKLLILSEFSMVLAENPAYEDVKSYYFLLGGYIFDQTVLLHGTFSKVLDSSKSNIDIFQQTLTFGANYNLDLSTILKLEYKIISPKNPIARPPPPGGGGAATNGPAGLFSQNPGRDVSLYGISINTMF